MKMEIYQTKVKKKIQYPSKNINGEELSYNLKNYCFDY